MQSERNLASTTALCLMSAQLLPTVGDADHVVEHPRRRPVVKRWDITDRISGYSSGRTDSIVILWPGRTEWLASGCVLPLVF